MRTIYLDYAATTPTDKRVLKEMLPYFTTKYGNPSSFHIKGLEAKKTITNAKERIAKILNCSSEELVFTGSGTESINIAIQGVARALKRRGRHIISTTIEHKAVLNTLKALKEEGFEITLLNVDKDGLVNQNELMDAIRKDTILVTIIYANNEIGVIQDIKNLAKIARERGVLFHTDACQAASTIDIDVSHLGVDLMTLNGSKIYATKGIGLLYVKKGVNIKPIIFGGGQEEGLRPGTENVPAIVGMAKALEICEIEKEEERKRLTKLRDYFIRRITKEIPKTILNGHREKRLANNINISFLDVEGESILLHLSEKGICASAGSACTSSSLEPSHVLIAIGRKKEIAHGSIRFSLGRFTTKKDIDYVMKVLPGIIKRLRVISSVNIKTEV